MTRKHVLLLVFAPLLAVGVTSHALGAPPQIGVFTQSDFSWLADIPVRIDYETRQIDRDGEHFIVKFRATYTNLQTGQTVELRGSVYQTFTVVDGPDFYMTQVKERGNLQFFVAGDVVPVRSGYLEITHTWYGHAFLDETHEVNFAGRDATSDFSQELYRLLSL